MIRHLVPPNTLPASDIERRKITYIKLNTQTPCCPRSAHAMRVASASAADVLWQPLQRLGIRLVALVPVSQHESFRYGCDRMKDVDVKLMDSAHPLQDGIWHESRALIHRAAHQKTATVKKASPRPWQPVRSFHQYVTPSTKT